MDKPTWLNDCKFDYYDGIICIEYTENYSAPELSFRMLFELSEWYGTRDIHVDQISEPGGCDTCDWGSVYGHKILVRGATRNN